jgi:hypothetical protein
MKSRILASFQKVFLLNKNYAFLAYPKNSITSQRLCSMSIWDNGASL